MSNSASATFIVRNILHKHKHNGRPMNVRCLFVIFDLSRSRVRNMGTVELGRKEIARRAYSDVEHVKIRLNAFALLNCQNGSVYSTVSYFQ